MNKPQGRLFYVILSGMILTTLIIYSVPAASASRGLHPTIAPGMPSEEPPPTNTPTPTATGTATPVTGLIFTGWTKGCTNGFYITCSATVTSTQTDPYRWDFDITYTYGDNRTNMGSNFTLNLVFDTGVFYTGVPIWWEMYPITNEVMPNRWIDVAYSGVSDLNPISYPFGSWMIPSQPSPYDTFRIKFSRVTGTTETLVRTDSWHVTVATYDYHALTPTPTATATLTSTPTNTQTNTPIATLTRTPTVVSTSTPPCYGSTCNGLYPNPIGCDVIHLAWTQNYKELKDVNNNTIGIVQNRISSLCYAQWGKTINYSGDVRYAEGSIRWGGAYYNSGIHPQSSPGLINDGQAIYTAMYGVNGGSPEFPPPTLACGGLSTDGPMEIPYYDPPLPEPILPSYPYFQNNCAAN